MARAHVVHFTSGRIRLRLKEAKGDHRTLRRLCDVIEALPGVREVSVNPTTGSVLVHYDPQHHATIARLMGGPEVHDEFGIDMPDLTDAGDLVDKVEREAEFLAEHSETALAVVKSVESLNHAIREASGNAIDLKVLVPGGLAVWAFMKAGAELATPLWISLAIFSFNSFVALHRPIRRTHDVIVHGR
jgi:cation transport ATPase